MSPRRAIWIATFLLAIASIYVNFFLNKTQAAVPRETLASFPSTVGDWVGADRFFSSGILQNLGVDEYIMRRFDNGTDTVWVYIGYYGNQKEGMVPHSPRHCYPGSGWFPLKNDIVEIPVGDRGHERIRVNRFLFAKGTERECVLYWYQSRGRVIADEYVEKLYLIRDAIFRNRSDGALVRLSIRTSAGSEESAMDILESFASTVYGVLPRYVPD